MLDIVIPQGNEKELIQMAHRLGYIHILLLYKTPTPAPPTNLPVGIKTGILLTKPEQRHSDTITAVESGEHDRTFLEKNPPTIMYNFENTPQPDTMHQRTSGLNHILATLATGKTRVYFSFANILNKQGIHRARLLGRIMQNILLCRKYKVQTGIASFATNPYQMRAPKDLQSYFSLLGMRPDELKKALLLQN